VQKKIPASLQSLLVSHLGRVEECLEPAFTQLTWSSLQVPEFVQSTLGVLKNLETLINRSVLLETAYELKRCASAI
jgi:hypothetical protein